MPASKILSHNQHKYCIYDHLLTNKLITNVTWTFINKHSLSILEMRWIISLALRNCANKTDMMSNLTITCLQERQSMHTNNISIKKKGNTISETINSAYIRKDIHRSLFSLATNPVRIRKSVLVSEEKYIKNNNTF